MKSKDDTLCSSNVLGNKTYQEYFISYDTEVAPPTTCIPLWWSDQSMIMKSASIFLIFFFNKTVDKYTVAICTMCSLEHNKHYMYSQLIKLISRSTLKVFAMRMALSLQLQDIHCIRNPMMFTTTRHLQTTSHQNPCSKMIMMLTAYDLLRPSNAGIFV